MMHPASTVDPIRCSFERYLRGAPSSSRASRSDPGQRDLCDRGVTLNCFAALAKAAVSIAITGHAGKLSASKQALFLTAWSKSGVDGQFTLAFTTP